MKWGEKYDPYDLIDEYSDKEVLFGEMCNDESLMHYGVKGMKWKDHVYAVEDTVSNAAGAIRDKYKKLRDEAIRYGKTKDPEIRAKLAQLKNQYHSAVAKGKQTAGAAYSVAKAEAKRVGNKARKMGEAAADYATSEGKKMYKKGKKIAEAAYNEASSQAKKYGKKAKRMAGEAYDEVSAQAKKYGKKALNKGKKMADEAYDYASSEAKKLAKKGKKKAKKAMNKAKKYISSYFD